MIEINKVYNTDCIAGMAGIKTGSVDMILTDLPYAVTHCKWDNLLPFDQLWGQYERVIKDNGAIVLTCCQPFTTQLISSNRKLFRYCWYWHKNQTTGFPFSKFQPLRCVEDIAVFYKRAPNYHPQGLIELKKPLETSGRSKTEDSVYRQKSLGKNYVSCYTNYPRNLLEVKCQREGLHPTQKPVELFEYFIRTYTNEGELVLDSCMGSGTTAIACMQARRNFIGFELDAEYYGVCTQRINQYKEKMK